MKRQRDYPRWAKSEIIPIANKRKSMSEIAVSERYYVISREEFWHLRHRIAYLLIHRTIRIKDAS
jgi:hypothetical protein